MALAAGDTFDLPEGKAKGFVCALKKTLCRWGWP